MPEVGEHYHGRGASSEDRRDIDWALAQARRRSSDPEPSLFDWIHAALTTDLAHWRGSLGLTYLLIVGGAGLLAAWLARRPATFRAASPGA